MRLLLEVAEENLTCPHCGEVHRDIDEWALKPHKTHLCLHCQKLFDGTMYGVSNPVLNSDYIVKFTVLLEVQDDSSVASIGVR